MSKPTKNAITSLSVGLLIGLVLGIMGILYLIFTAILPLEQQVRELQARPCTRSTLHTWHTYSAALDFCHAQLEMVDRECYYCVSKCMVSHTDEKLQTTVWTCKGKDEGKAK